MSLFRGNPGRRFPKRRNACRAFGFVLVAIATLVGSVTGAGFDAARSGSLALGNAGLAASGRPNLIPLNVVASSYSTLPGDVITVEWTMTNAGSGFCPASFTAVRLGASPTAPLLSDPVALTFTTPELPARSAVRQTATITMPFAAPLGSYYVWIVAEAFGNGLNQTSREDDAARSSALALQNVRAQPNLRPLNISLSAEAVRPGDLLTVMWTLTNSGSVTCPSSYTGLHLGTSRLSAPRNDLNLQIPTPEIEAHSSVRFTNVVTIPGGTALGTYYLWIVADDVQNSTLNQSSRDDDAATSTGFSITSVLPRPNLIPQNVTLSSYSARPGDLVSVMWTVTNGGNGNCPASITGLHLGISATAPPASDGLNLQLPTPAISAGASVRLTNAVTIPANIPFGTYYIWIVADDLSNSPLNQTSREDDAARSAALTIEAVVRRPNLVPQNILLSTYAVRPGDPLQVMWTTTNMGNGDCPASFTGLRLGTSRLVPPDSDGSSVHLPTPGMPAQSAVRQTNIVTIPANIPTGNYYLWVVVDDVPDSTLGQSSRADDAARSAVFGVVTVVGQPNLVPQSIALSSEFVRPGEPITVRWSMRNAGNVTCPTSLTGLRLSTSATAATNETLHILWETPEIAAGASLEQTHLVTIPTNTVAGTYYFWVVADDAEMSTLNQISRADDAARSGPLIIATELPRANLVPLNVTLNVSSTQPGGQASVAWTMTNSGTANCPASTTGLHLGTSMAIPSTNDGLNLRIATAAISAGSSLRQTNVITIPTNIMTGTYYVWVVADDVVNSGLNQSSKADDGASSGPLTIFTESPRPNLVATNVTLKVRSARPSTSITVIWTLTNSGSSNCPASTTGFHLGASPNVPPANDNLNVKVATPTISAGSSLRQTNVVTIPGNTPTGSYYLWVVADDVPNSSLNQTSKADDASRSGVLIVSRVTLTSPASLETVSAPPTFSWSSLEIPAEAVYLANKAEPLFGVDSIVFFDNSTGMPTLRPTAADWADAVSQLGFAQHYYWTAGNGNPGQRAISAEWRPFKVLPMVRGGEVVPMSGADFQFEIISPNQAQVAVQASASVTNDWLDLGTRQNPTGSVIYRDETAGGERKRFYRAKP